MEYWLSEQSYMNPNKIAITDGVKALTFRTLYDRAKVIAEHLVTLNISRVGLYLTNSINSVILIHACWIAHIEIAMINTRLTPKEITAQMQSIDVQYIITTASLALKDFNIIPFQSLIDKRNKGLISKSFNQQDIASIMFTSGTTGPQKAVPQTFNNHYASAKGCKSSLGFDSTTIWLSVLPIYHISGLSVLLRSVIEGFTVRLLDKFDTQRMMHIIKNEHITHVSLVPQTLQWLMDAGLTQPYKLEKILLGGAKLSVALIDEALNYQLPIYNSFGMTETCSQFLTASPDMLARRHDTVGKPSSKVSIKIHNPNRDGHGELWLKGNNVMDGYLYPKGLKDAFVDGYFKTGDIAEVDKDGFVVIYDRRKDLIISGGENIYPYEIEMQAKQFDGIKDAMCVPLSDETWGQVPLLYYISEDNIDIASLDRFLRVQLAAYKVPKKYVAVQTLPYTSTGKLQRNKFELKG